MKEGEERRNKTEERCKKEEERKRNKKEEKNGGRRRRRMRRRRRRRRRRGTYIKPKPKKGSDYLFRWKPGLYYIDCKMYSGAYGVSTVSRIRLFSLSHFSSLLLVFLLCLVYSSLVFVVLLGPFVSLLRRYIIGADTHL